jgi:tRNA modification GTPase
METIVALSSGQGRAGIAVIRVSGPHVRFVIETICRRELVPRYATLTVFRSCDGLTSLDTGMALLFPRPASATGEDVLELHVHGGPAVVRSVIREIRLVHPRIRMAEPGEFSRHALENGKLDLLTVEGLGELLAAETDGQLVQARRQMSGELSRQLAEWREQLTGVRALIEAHLDFSDEGDVPPDVHERAATLCQTLSCELRTLLAGAERGERMREGVRVAIIGPPNVGKSSLINALARRDVAIVSSIAGTTRDVVEATIAVGGWPLLLQDTAGLRETSDPIEQEGVRRARLRAQEADLVLVLSAPDVQEQGFVDVVRAVRIDVGMKSDLGGSAGADKVAVSAVTGEGMELLESRIRQALDDRFGSETALVSRERHVEALRDAQGSVERALMATEPELMAEDLRLASRAVGRLAGEVGVEAVLDRLFQGFCIGK